MLWRRCVGNYSAWLRLSCRTIVFHDVFVLGKVHLAGAIINMGNDVMLKTIKPHKLNRMPVLYDRDNLAVRDEKPVRDAYLPCADPIQVTCTFDTISPKQNSQSLICRF
jgi:hypothetical protein